MPYRREGWNLRSFWRFTSDTEPERVGYVAGDWPLRSYRCNGRWQADVQSPLRSSAVKTTLRALTEIRLRRSEDVLNGREADGARDHLWIPATHANIGRLVRAVELGNRLHGPATHWIERRQA